MIFNVKQGLFYDFNTRFRLVEQRIIRSGVYLVGIVDQFEIAALCHAEVAVGGGVARDGDLQTARRVGDNVDRCSDNDIGLEGVGSLAEGYTFEGGDGFDHLGSDLQVGKGLALGVGDTLGGDLEIRNHRGKKHLLIRLQGASRGLLILDSLDALRKGCR